MRIGISRNFGVFRGREVGFWSRFMEKKHFHEISDTFMKSRIYSCVKIKKSNHKNALEAHFCDLISGKTISDIFMGNLGYIHG